jgi:ABC-type multidrug transport system fused ATPase/permease subunit
VTEIVFVLAGVLLLIIVAWRVPSVRVAALSVAAVLLAGVGVKFLGARLRDRADRDRERTRIGKAIREGRRGGYADRKRTEEELNEQVRRETSIHLVAEEEQERLAEAEPTERERLES